MANSIDTKRIQQELWPSALAGTVPQWSRVGRVIPGLPGTIKIADFAMGAVPSTIADNASSDPSASDFASFQASFNTAEKAVVHTFATHLLDNQVFLDAKIADLAIAIQKAVDLDFFSGLEGLLSAAHPRVGTSVGQVGAGKYYIDTGKKGLQGEGGEFTYANKIATDFGRDGLNAAFTLLSSTKTDRGIPLDLGRNGMVLVVNKADEMAAHEATQSILSSSAMGANFYQGMNVEVVSWNFTDTDSWYLIDKAACPVGYCLARPPTVEVRQSATGKLTHLVASYNGCFGYSPYEYGLVGSAGA